MVLSRPPCKGAILLLDNLEEVRNCISCCSSCLFWRIFLRILHVSTFFNEHGGVEKSVSDLCRGLASAHQLDVLCTAIGHSTKRKLENISVTAAGGLLSVS